MTRLRGMRRGESSGPQRPGREAEETKSLPSLLAYFLHTSPSEEIHLVTQQSRSWAPGQEGRQDRPTPASRQPSALWGSACSTRPLTRLTFFHLFFSPHSREKHSSHTAGRHPQEWSCPHNGPRPHLKPGDPLHHQCQDAHARSPHLDQTLAFYCLRDHQAEPHDRLQLH